LLAVSLIFSSFGSATGQSAAQSSPVAQKKAEISVIVATGYKGYFEDVLLKSMAKKYPKVTVKVTYNSEPTPTIQQQLAAEGGPDVVGTQGTTALLDYARTNHVNPCENYPVCSKPELLNL